MGSEVPIGGVAAASVACSARLLGIANLVGRLELRPGRVDLVPQGLLGGAVDEVPMHAGSRRLVEATDVVHVHVRPVAALTGLVVFVTDGGWCGAAVVSSLSVDAVGEMAARAGLELVVHRARWVPITSRLRRPLSSYPVG